MRQCSKCKQWKKEIEFYFRKNENRYSSWCKSCTYKSQKNYNKKHKKEISEYQKNYRKEHKRENSKYMKKYQTKWYQENKEKIAEKDKIYFQNNKEKINKRNRERQKNDLKYRLKKRISSAIRDSLKGNKAGRHWENLVGYTLRDLMKHLEKQFTAEMSWKNYGIYWSIDHLIPISVFNFDSYEHIDFKRCWSLSNLRSLDKIENIRKGNKINKSFQPNLKIGD